MAKEKREEFDLLVKVLKDLRDFQPYLVLVGGWVPYLYNRFIWKPSGPDPFVTMDIDFGLRNIAFKGKETVAHRIIQKKYREHHVELGKEVPFVPIAEIKGRQADVEFICEPTTPEKIKTKLIGQEILINALPHTEVLLEKTIPLKIEGIKISIPNPLHYAFQKFLTFVERENPLKRAKDLSYAYYVIRFGPDQEKFKSDLGKMIKTHPKGKLVKKNISSAFEDSSSEGPTLISKEFGKTLLSTLEIDFRLDSFEKINDLI